MTAMNIIAAAPAQWFHGVDALLELFSFFIAFLIASIGYKAYKLSNLRRYLAFSGAFALLALSFAARMFSEMLIYLEVLRDVRSSVSQGLPVDQTFLIGRFIFIIVVFTAYTLLLAVSMRLEHKPTLALILSLLAILAFLAHTHPSTVVFHVVTLLLMLFITSHFLHNYLKRKSRNALLTCTAFFVLTFEVLFFLLANFFPWFYFAAFGSRFIGYSLLLSTFLRVQRT